MRRELLSCGLSNDGQLGIRRTDGDCINVPEHIIGGPNGEHGSTVIAVACGEKHTLFLAEDGQVWSVGCNEYGQLGRGSRSSGSFTIYPVGVTGAKVIQIAAGRHHSLALMEDGRIFSWGSNQRGQLALSSSIQCETVPKRISQLNEVVQVSAGQDHTIALTENGRVWVWGEQSDGAIFHTPVEVTALIGLPIVRVCAGGRHYLALTASSFVYAWGANDYGQLGLGDAMPRVKPEKIETISDMKVCEIAAGYSHSLLLTADGRLFAFGSDTFGQLGFGRKTERQTIPTAVTEVMGSTVTRIACGRCHSVAVIGGKLYPFGLNTSGQLGNGSTRNQITPRQTESLHHVSTVFAGWDQTFIIRASGDPAISPGPSAPLKLPRFLSTIQVLDWLERKEKLDLIGAIESVFSSLSSINGSFLFDDERRYISSSGCRNSGVNMDSVMECFNALTASHDVATYHNLIIEMCHMSLFSGEFDPDLLNSPECFRVFLILPWLGSFVENVTNEIVKTLHMPFATMITQLPEAKRAILEKWWIFLPRRHFNRIVSAMLNGVRCLVKGKATPEECLPMLLLLQSLNRINRKTNTIPFENFYIDELNDNYNLNEDYVYWVSNEKYNRNGNTVQKFWAHFPFLMNGIAKAELLQIESAVQQHEIVSQGTLLQIGPLQLIRQPYLVMTIRRANIVHDTLSWIGQSSHTDLLRPLKIEFIGEEGEDAGGVKKEFFILLFQQILLPDYAMFLEDSDSHYVWFSGYDIVENISYRILGILFGMAIYNNVLVPFPFPLALYKLILDQSPTLDDLCELSPIEGKSLQQLLDYEGDDFEDVFSLNFSISYNMFGNAVTSPLKINGEEITVKQSNKQEYVNLYIKHRLELGYNDVIAQQLEAFKDGFRMLIKNRLLHFFQPRELMEMVIGNENYDWSEFRECVQYKEPYHADHPTIKAFWDAFFKLSLDERKNFMKFLMGSTRLPVQGLRAITVLIQPCAQHLLPVAHTCGNLLELPQITDVNEMHRRLLISIKHTEGFTLV